jgi:hypothetical protein
MGKQHNKMEKRKRRKAYLKRRQVVPKGKAGTSSSAPVPAAASAA